MPSVIPRFPRLRVWCRRIWRFRSAGLGFSLGYGIVFAVSAALFLSLLWWHTNGLLERQVEQAVDADAHSLTEHWLEDGLGGVIRVIQERLDLDVEDESLYLLIGPQGEFLAGNMPAWPALVQQDNQYYSLKITRAGRRAVAEIHAYRFPGGFRLLVGRDVRGRELLRHLLTDTFLWAWIMVTALAVGGGLVVRGIFRRILTSIARTTSAIARGDMRERMPITGNEVDLVAHTVNTMLDRIQRLMEGVKQVSNAIAHDLRTPITRARARLEDASLHAESNEEMHQAIDRAVADLDAITAVFDALLRIAQIEAGARRAAFETCDLVPSLHDISELYDASAEERGLHLKVSLPSHLSIYGDARLIQQAVANLLDNAIKFSPPDTDILMQARATSDGIRISVLDRGPGMSCEEMSRASERFFRADAARNTPGSGLGLALVQAVAHLHGGTFQLENANPGTRALLLMPKLTPRAITQESSSDHLAHK